MGLVDELEKDCGFNYKEAFARFLNKEDMVKEFLKLFIDVEKKEIAELTKSYENQDIPSLRNHAHSIKGAARNVSLCNLGNLGSALQWVCDGMPSDYGDVEVASTFLKKSLEGKSNVDNKAALYEAILLEFSKVEEIIKKYIG